ncbi:hypothetical protein [Acidiphilium sp.]|uniref:hypothetical protein n=1 Tax=Acidiphilium sp. TaxID=527 RepID=UPI003D03DF84
MLIPYIIRFLPWILAGLFVVGGVIYIRHLQDELTIAHQDVAVAEGTINQLRATNQQNLVMLKRLQAENEAWQSTLTTTIASDNKITHFTDGLLATISATPTTENAPVAPVLSATLAAIAKEQGIAP